MSLILDDMGVVVTGGGSGIGLALARHAAMRGATVAIIDISEEKAMAAASALAVAGAEARGFACDVTDARDVDRLRDHVLDEIGAVDMLFNNAGIGVAGKVDEITEADVGWTLAVNVGGMMNCTRAFSPALRAAASAKGTAWIVNTGSEHALGIPTMGPSNIYTASKHAVLGLSDVMRADLADAGIKVAVLCPGLVATSMYDACKVRPASFGGAFAMPEEHRAQAAQFVATGQDPALTASICFEGLAEDEFIIVADPTSRPFVEARLREIARALDVADARVGRAPS